MSGHSASTATAFVFSSEPRAIAPRKKYREPLYLRNADSVDKSKGNCIQYDKRVARGITAMGADQPRENLPMMGQETVESPEAQLDQTKADSAQRWLDEARTAAKEQMKVSFAPKTMDVTRKHIEVDLSAFLIEEVIPVDVKIMQTQTDVFQPRPPSPDYVPKRTGLDVATQIYSGDLFDFDREVDLILDVITGKTLEQSMMEVMEEEEVTSLKAHQAHFEDLEEQNRAKIKEMEIAESKLYAERTELLRKAKKKAENELKVRHRVHSTLFADSFLDGLEDTALDSLAERGYFYDPLERTVELNFMPWLLANVESRVDQLVVSRVMTDKIVAGAIERSKLEQKMRREELLRRAAQEKARLAEKARLEREEFIENNLELVVNMPGLRGHDGFEAAMKAAALQVPTVTCNVDQRLTGAEARASIASQVSEQLNLPAYAPDVPFGVKSLTTSSDAIDDEETLFDQNLESGARIEATLDNE